MGSSYRFKKEVSSTTIQFQQGIILLERIMRQRHTKMLSRNDWEVHAKHRQIFTVTVETLQYFV